MAEAESRSITRRSMLAGSVVPAAAFAACLPAGAEAAVARLEPGESRGPSVPARSVPDFADAQSGLRAQPGLREGIDPVHAAIEVHRSAYAAYDAQQKAEPEDEVTLEPLIDAERDAAEVLAATVPTTLAGAAAALSYVRTLHQRDGYPLFDDWSCYVFIASTETAMRHALNRSPA